MKLDRVWTSVEGKLSMWMLWKLLKRFQPVRYDDSVLGARSSRIAPLVGAAR